MTSCLSVRKSYIDGAGLTLAAALQRAGAAGGDAPPGALSEDVRETPEEEAMPSVRGPLQTRMGILEIRQDSRENLPRAAAKSFANPVSSGYEYRFQGGDEAIIYVMSDLHGCYDKYKEMLELIAFAPKDTLYVLGDVIDRGPDGIKILRDMMFRHNVFPLLGNHEFTAAVCLPWLMEEVTSQSLESLDETQVAALSEWIINGGGVTIRSLKDLDQEAREDLLDYLREMELFAQVKAGDRSFVLLHSGLDRFSPDKKLEEYALEDFLFGRPDLDTVYYPDKILVFGHTPTRVLGGGDKILRRETWIDIDCGCVFEGGRLGCLCLNTMEEFYV